MKSSSTLLFLLSTAFLLLFLSLPSPCLSQKTRCHPEDERVLLRVKKAFNNPYQLASWVPGTDCCDWYVIDCDLTTNRVIGLSIFNGNISGEIPAAVGDLPYLQNLVLRKLSNLTGPIPPAIAKLTHLTELRLSWTNLSGPVPSFLSQLKSLTFLDLAFNDLTGSIPPSLSDLQNLNALHLDRNNLTGNIPESFGRFTGNVPDLYLSHNQLTGTVPRSLGDLNFSVLDFSRNRLEGDISFLFGKNKSVGSIDISRNMLEFNFSMVQEFPDSLSYLDLNHNRIFGSLPQGLAEIDLQFFNVSYNRLCGQIPTGGQLQNFDSTSYFHNRCLCGAPLPACK